MTPKPGQVTTVPAIQLDGAGSVTGTVTDAATGKGVPDECVEVTPLLGDLSAELSCQGRYTDANGHYTLSGVGPYSWPVEFGFAPGYAFQFSGGAATRKQATLVHVSVGGTATANAKLTKGTTVSGSIRATNGIGLRAHVYLYNTDTGDTVGFSADEAFGSYAIGVLPQTVRIGYLDDRDPATSLWYRNAADAAHATAVTVGGTPVTVDLVGR